jgi:Peptidase S46
VRRGAWLLAAVTVVAGVTAGVRADEGMWRIDQLPYAAIAARYGVRLTPADMTRVQAAVVRLQSGGGGGTGTFASPDGLILTNHHVALDCIRTSALADESAASADSLIETGFTAANRGQELPCKRFRAQIERSARDVTAQLNAAVTPGMAVADVQRARQAARSDLERACAAERGDAFTCAVVDFNSGARSLLIVYEEFRDLRLVYAPEKQLGYYGGDEMNFRFPRFAADISILRAYQGADGDHGEYDAAHVPVRPDSYLRVSMAGVEEGDFTFVVGNPGNTNRYRMSYSARYNLLEGIPNQIRDLQTALDLLRRHAARAPENQVLLQSRIFSLANTLKYEQDVLAALRSTNIVEDRVARERDFMAYVNSRPEVAREFGDVLASQAAVYANDVEAYADVDAALDWFGRSDLVSYASSLFQFAQARGKASDEERPPQYQERNWANVRAALLDDDPILPDLEEDVLAVAFEKALALPEERRLAAVQALVAAEGTSDARALARAVVSGSAVASVSSRGQLAEAGAGAFLTSSDPVVRFAVALDPALADRRVRVAVLNEKIFQNRSRFARGLAAWKGTDLYPDANFTLRATFGQVAGYTSLDGEAVPFTTRLGGLFDLAEARGNAGDFALPSSVVRWRRAMGDAAFEARYARLPVDFVTTNDITGGNSGSATLNASLEIVGLIFDGNEEAMAGDWTYSESAGRALSTDIRFALTLAREVHGAGWVVDELLVPVGAGRSAGIM